LGENPTQLRLKYLTIFTELMKNRDPILQHQKFNILGNIDNYLYLKYLTIYNINFITFRKVKKDLNNPLHGWMIFFEIESSDELIKK
jgi:hypothetical protein